MKMRTFSIRMPEELIDRIGVRSKITRRSRSSEIVYLVEWALAEKERLDYETAIKAPFDPSPEPPQ